MGWLQHWTPGYQFGHISANQSVQCLVITSVEKGHIPRPRTQGRVEIHRVGKQETQTKADEQQNLENERPSTRMRSLDRRNSHPGQSWWDFVFGQPWKHDRPLRMLQCPLPAAVQQPRLHFSVSKTTQSQRIVTLLPTFGLNSQNDYNREKLRLHIYKCTRSRVMNTMMPSFDICISTSPWLVIVVPRPGTEYAVRILLFSGLKLHHTW